MTVSSSFSIAEECIGWRGFRFWRVIVLRQYFKGSPGKSITFRSKDSSMTGTRRGQAGY
jgi:hypothetical protein